MTSSRFEITCSINNKLEKRLKRIKRLTFGTLVGTAFTFGLREMQEKVRFVIDFLRYPPLLIAFTKPFLKAFFITREGFHLGRFEVSWST